MDKVIHHIKKLRAQPEETRVYILHLLTVVAGIILFSLWVYSLGTDLSDKETQAKLKNDIQPFSTLKSNLIDGYNSLGQ